MRFNSDDAVFLDTFARFISVALKAGDAAIAVITERHRDGLAPKLKALGLDVDAATQQGPTFMWMLTRRFPHSWSMACQTRLDFSRL
jgi:hypothetical protein